MNSGYELPELQGGSISGSGTGGTSEALEHGRESPPTPGEGDGVRLLETTNPFFSFLSGDDDFSTDDSLAPSSQTRHRGGLRNARNLLTLVLAVAVVALSIALALVASDEAPSSNTGTTPAFAALPPADRRIARLAFGSCAKQNYPQPYWDVVSALTPAVDALILLGDNVYGDCSDAECRELERAYQDLMDKPSFLGARRLTPMVAVWDDHDAGQNDAWSANPFKAYAKSLFLGFWQIPLDDERHSRDGLYRSYLWGPPGQRLQVILLDTRWFRSEFMATDEPMTPGKERYMPRDHSDEYWAARNDDQGGGGDDDDDLPTMLGEVQWAWLEQQLLVEDVALRLVVSSVQLAADDVGWEAWCQLPSERRRFYALVAATTAQSGGTVLVVSGDRHVGGFYTFNYSSALNGVPPVQPFLLDVTASSWTHTVPLAALCELNQNSNVTSCGPHNCSAAACDEPGPNRIGSLVRDNHFGTIDVDWPARAVTVALRRAQTSEGATGASDAGTLLREMSFEF